MEWLSINLVPWSLLNFLHYLFNTVVLTKVRLLFYLTLLIYENNWVHKAFARSFNGDILALPPHPSLLWPAVKSYSGNDMGT